MEGETTNAESEQAGEPTSEEQKLLESEGAGEAQAEGAAPEGQEVDQPEGVGDESEAGPEAAQVEGQDPESETPAGEAEAAGTAVPSAESEPAVVPDERRRVPNLKGLIGRKMGMAQIFDDTGAAIPVTLIEAGPCYIAQIRTHASDGYNSVQLAFGEGKQRRLTGGQLGHLKRNDLPPLRYLREFRVKDLGDLEEGQEVTVEVFEIGDRVDIVGTSKGRGFAGAIKRHGFHRGPKTHGQSDRERAPGSHGATSTPGRVFKGSRGPGHMGSNRVSSQNLRIDLVDREHNLLGVRGSVPGPKGGLVLVKEGRKQ